MTANHYKPYVIEALYREHKALMREAADMDAIMAREPSPYMAATSAPAKGNRAERRRQAAQARKTRP